MDLLNQEMVNSFKVLEVRAQKHAWWEMGLETYYLEDKGPKALKKKRNTVKKRSKKEKR